MEHHSIVLVELATELFSPEELAALQGVSQTRPLDRKGLVHFDRSLGGPSVAAIADPRMAGGTLGIPGYGTGRYKIADRDVFRPLQYCSVCFIGLPEDTEWLTRQVVEMSSAHIEALVKRIGGFPFLPLGAALRKTRVRNRVDPVTWHQIERFTPIYNQAKHRFDHPKDTHLFSMEDAVLAYFVCRRLGQKLYALAKLSTDLAAFKEDVS